MKILSTKILKQEQEALLAAYELQQIPMISVAFGEGFELNETIDYAVFTSGNSVKSVFDHHKIDAKWFDKVFCVGGKTKVLLEKRGISVVEVAHNALELSEKIVQNFKDIQEISWFCGNLRNNDLPTIMAENGVLVTEYLVYQTELLSPKVDQDFEAILFFSPSGVKGYVKENKTFTAKAICIGSTTATEALDYFEEVYISEHQSVEGVINKLKEIQR